MEMKKLERIAPGYYEFQNDHNLKGCIDKLDCGWVVRMHEAAFNYSDPVRTYKEAKKIADEWNELF